MLTKARGGWREKEEKLISSLICRHECGPPDWTRFFSRRRCLAHIPSSLCSCLSSSLSMTGWEEGESTRLCFIIALAKCTLFFFSFRLSHALVYGLYLSSSLKDLVCSPRPYALLVTRLSKGQTISSSVLRLISRLAIRSHHSGVRLSLDPFYELRLHGVIPGRARSSQ